LDDQANIELTQVDEFSIKNIVHVVAHNQSGLHSLSRAVPSISFAATYVLHGDQKSYYKYHNILLHILCGLLVFLFTRQFDKIITGNSTEALFIPTFTCFAWLMHPLLVSTTLYSVQRITQFSTLFTLSALYFYLLGTSSSKNHQKVFWYFIAFPISFCLGLMSKESAAHDNDEQKIGHYFLLIFGWVATILGIFAFLYKAPDLMSSYDNRLFNLEERLMSQVHIVFGYLSNIILPQLGSMGLLNDDIVPTSSFDLWTALKLITLITFFAISIYLALNKNPLGLFAIFFIGHLMESTIIPLELAFEHRNYFPAVGVLAALAYLIQRIHKPLLRYVSAGTVLIVLFSLLTIRVHYWSNEHEWQKTVLAYHPDSPRAQISYSNYLSKYYGPEAAIENISRQEERLKSTGLSVARLIYNCMRNLESEQEISEQIMERIRARLTYKNITIADKAQLLQLSSAVLLQGCEYINVRNLFELVDWIIRDRKEKGIEPGSLYAVKADLLYFAGFNEDASNNYIDAFKATNRIGFLMRGVIALASGPDTFEKAELLASEIANGAYVDPKAFQLAINEMLINMEEFRRHAKQNLGAVTN